DTLNQIARHYGTDIWTLMRLNGLHNANHIYVGQVLRIPSYCPPSPPPPPPPPPPSGKWFGSYYNNKDLSGSPVFTRHDHEINFGWGYGGPGSGIGDDNFSVRWERSEWLSAGNYRFFATVDDGVRVYVDNVLVIDAWRVQPSTSYFGDIYLGEGHHNIRIEFFEDAGSANIHVYWQRL